MEINTHVPFGAAGLHYPHVTKKENGLIHFVTHPDKLVSVGDVVFDSFDQRQLDGTFETKYLQTQAVITEVVECRPARGQHNTDFTPMFQLLRY